MLIIKAFGLKRLTTALLYSKKTFLSGSISVIYPDGHLTELSNLLLSLPRPFQKHHPLFYTCGPNSWEQGRGPDVDMPDDQVSHPSSDTSRPGILRLLPPFSGKGGHSNDGEVLTASESWTRPRVGSGKRTTHSHPGSRSPQDLRLSRVLQAH